MSITLGSYLLPILQTLATHGPDVVVPSSTVKTAVQASVGLPDDVTKANAMVDNAAYELKLRECLTTHGRAGWALTPLGLDVAENRVALPTKGAPKAPTQSAPPAPTPPVPVVSAPVVQVTPPPPVVVTVPPAVVPQAPVTAPAPVATVPEPTVPEPTVPEPTVSVVVSDPAPPGSIEAIIARVTEAFVPPRVNLPVIPSSEWLHDDSVRATVTANTACFGQWSASDVSCEGCALNDYCRMAQAGVLRLLADRLMVKKLQADAKRLQTAVAASMGVTPRSPATLSSGTPLIAPNDGFCPVTQKPYTAGQRVFYIPGFGNCLSETA